MGPLGTNFSEISIQILISRLRKMHLEVLSGNVVHFCLVLNVPSQWGIVSNIYVNESNKQHWQLSIKLAVNNIFGRINTKGLSILYTRKCHLQYAHVPMWQSIDIIDFVCVSPDTTLILLLVSELQIDHTQCRYYFIFHPKMRLCNYLLCGVVMSSSSRVISIDYNKVPNSTIRGRLSLWFIWL